MARAALFPAWGHSRTLFYISCFPQCVDRGAWPDQNDKGNKTKILGGWALSIWVLVF